MGTGASTGREVHIKRTRDGFRWALEKAHSDMSRLVGEGQEEQASGEMRLQDRIIFLESERVRMKEALIRQSAELREMDWELKQQQEKTKQLMFGQLPYRILLTDPEQLRETGSLLARKFSMASFVSCNIVNFSKLSSLLSPLDMVTLLDRMHLAVASAFSDESVYLMERASERCLAVSGLVEYPEARSRRNISAVPEERDRTESDTKPPSFYAAKLATAALQLLSNTSAVKVPRYPRSMLQLRVSLHSGACLGGVTGLQNISLLQIPHYRLFGEAVEFARYLSATCLPLQIRVSAASHQLLSAERDFRFERCPDCPAPNGDSIESYWLLDKKGLDINLPSQEEALPLSECEDIFTF